MISYRRDFRKSVSDEVRQQNLSVSTPALTQKVSDYVAFRVSMESTAEKNQRGRFFSLEMLNLTSCEAIRKVCLLTESELLISEDRFTDLYGGI